MLAESGDVEAEISERLWISLVDFTDQVQEEVLAGDFITSENKLEDSQELLLSCAKIFGESA